MTELNLDESTKVLEQNGLYVDDLSRVRVVDPETADASGRLASRLETRFCSLSILNFI